jgi:aldehyde dehydrogenase (NAD+)
MTTKIDVRAETASLLDKLGVARAAWTGGDMASFSPVSGEEIAKLKTVSAAEAGQMIVDAHEAFKEWRLVPAPRRGELVRLLGEELRASKTDLGRLVSLEAGKIASEGLGEVQEMIDICDFAVGLSRQLYGLTIATERPGHRMMETWHPLGVVGIISAFNFPVAVVVELGAGAGLRQLGRVETFGKDAADRARLSGNLRACGCPLRRSTKGTVERPDRRA